MIYKYYPGYGILGQVGLRLVVLTAYCHAGLINILQYAKRLTGVSKTYAIIGGFHLTGPIFDPIRLYQ